MLRATDIGGSTGAKGWFTTEHEHYPTGDPLPAGQSDQIREFAQGSRPGNRYVRMIRSSELPASLANRVLVAPPTTPSTTPGRLYHQVKHLLFGKPLPTAAEAHERLSKIKALAILSSDALSSVAYATEEMMRVLVLAGLAAISFTLPLSLAVLVVLVTVVISYEQVIKGYPGGGGSYAVASENLGQLPGLTAAAALLIDYTLTVAVSIAAGIAALTSAFPTLYPYRVELAVGAIVLLTIGNLRGIREAGNIFAAPTYLFVISLLGLIGIGLWQYLTGSLPTFAPPPSWVAAEQGVQALTLILILRAFSSGLTALTGTEAISNSVPTFKRPEIRNARITLASMGVLLGIMFLGISFLTRQMMIIPDPSEEQTVLSMIARLLVGESWYFYLVQFATMLILVLAANTSYTGFPRLAAILAQDRYFPHQFMFRGERLAFNTGILVLAILAGVLEVIFRGSVTALIPLYAVGVFTAFTLAQTGMVVHWWRSRERGWRHSMVINGAGAIMTGVATIIIAVSKFLTGAWIVLVLVPLIVWQLRKIHRHYERVATQLRLSPEQIRHWPRPVDDAGITPVIIPVDRLNQASLHALAYAGRISNDVSAVHISTFEADADAIRRQWDEAGIHIPLTIIESPYREMIGPLVDYIEQQHVEKGCKTLTVVVPEFVPAHLYELPLHMQTAWLLRTTLWTHPGIVVTSVPYHLRT
ncbi:MAG TPA: APC family permease [Nitrolancea sp.]|nr:APC family permease [Nitrolancea sp.]